MLTACLRFFISLDEFPITNKLLFMKPAIGAVFFLLLLYNCEKEGTTQFEPRVVQLEQRIRKTACNKAELQRQIDSAWNVAVVAMAQDLPEDLEPGTRANFLGLKAEHLVKMLPEYKVLKKETKQLVSEAAALDSVLTLQFKILLKEYDACESEMKAFLKEVETNHPQLRIKYLKRLQAAQKESCKTTG